MTKRYEEPIEVAADLDGAPVAFLWRRRRYEVDLWLGSWREAGEWWLAAGRSGSAQNGSGSAGARDREFFRVQARPAGVMATGDLDPDGFLRRSEVGGVYDLYKDLVTGTWRLARIWD